MKNHYLKWLLATLCLLTFDGYAQSIIPTHVYRIVSRSSGKSLEIGGGGNLNDPGRETNTWDYWAGANQQWTFEPVYISGRISSYVIANRNSKLALSGFTAAAGSAFSQAVSSYNPNVPNSSPYNEQAWHFFQPSSAAGSPYVIYLNDNYYMTTDGDNHVFKQRYSSGNIAQLWDIIDVSVNGPTYNDPSLASYQLINVNSGKALSVDPGDTGSRNVMQLPITGKAYQEWSFVPSPTNSGYYYIVNRRNNLVLDIWGPNTANGSVVNLWDNNRNSWQEWAFLDINDSHILTPNEFLSGRIIFKIYTRYAGKILEIGNGSTSDGASANIWNDFSTPTQQWRTSFSAYNVSGDPSPSSSALGATSNVNADLSPNLAADKLFIYPNPAADKLFMIASGDLDLAKSSVSLTDVRGSKVKAAYQSGQIDVSGLATGLYFVTISDGKHTIRQKFTKL